ncbi:MAG: SDR family NAD(P)-dependent oxidoreductase [Pseudomonadota bacterium]
MSEETRCDGRAVLVTGSTRGLGLRMTQHLADLGYFVYAGARSDDDIERLDAMPNVSALRIDVTDEAQIADAAARVESEGRGLYGLVNNAGIAVVAPLMETSPGDFHAIMQTNVYGPYRMLRAFAPLLIAEQGRIVSISSVAGFTSFPGFGAYSASKHALESLTDTLAVEMKSQGVHVTVVEPGNYAVEFGGGDPLDVARAVAQALSEQPPKRRYLVVPHEDQAETTLRHVIGELLQLNQRHRFSRPVADLVAMLQKQARRFH